MEQVSLTHFRSIPWCRTLISDPTFTLTPTYSRQPKPNHEDSLFALTLISPTTIPYCLSFYKVPPKDELFITHLQTLFALSTGLNGGPNLLHGGIISTLIDDVMGTLLTVNKDQGGLPLSQSTVTGEMKVRYLRPVRTPGTVVVVAECVKREGRRICLEGEVRDVEGVVLARGEAVWVKVGGGKL